MSTLHWLMLDASPLPTQPFDKTRVYPGWIGLAFLVGLGCAVAALWFSMRKQLGRIDVGRHQRECAGPPPPSGGGPDSPGAGGGPPPPPGSAASPPTPPKNI